MFVFILNPTFTIIKKCFTVFKRFEIFCRVLDTEMKDGTRADVALQTKREEKEAVSDEDKQLFRRNIEIFAFVIVILI